MNEGGTGRAYGAAPNGPIARMMRQVTRPTRGWVVTESDLQDVEHQDVEHDEEVPVVAGQGVSAPESEGQRPARRPLSTIRFEADSEPRKESER